MTSTKMLITTALCVAAALGAAGPAAATTGYDECGGAAYAVQLKVDLDTGTFTGDHFAATGRAREYAANASPDIAGDATTLVDADVAVLDGASTTVFTADPVIQAWGDVVDWHTVHCLGFHGA